MNITLKLKPIIMTAPTKYQLMQKILSNFNTRGHCIGTGGTYISTRNDDRLVYVLHKVRAKWKRSGKKSTKPNAFGHKVLSSTKVRDAHWIAQVYVFKKDFPVRVTQKLRHFDLTIDPRSISIYN